MYVYACVYTKNGDFCLGTKLADGYFFFENGAGAIVPNGQRLNGGGRPALPGGGLHDREGIAAGARREWLEETGVAIAPCPEVEKAWGASYAGGYFELTSGQMETAATTIDRDVLPAAALAAAEIAAGRINTYAQIHVQFPPAPASNELATVQIWNVHTDWTRIARWQGDPDLGWFYNILDHLRRVILAAVVVTQSAEGVTT